MLIIALSQIANLHANSLAKPDADGKGVLDACTCFVKGTLVLVAPHTYGAFRKNGTYYKEIQDIRGGDTVIAWNEKTGELTYSKVQETFIRTTDAIYKVTYADGTAVETTWSHPFYIAGTGWVKGKDLRVGMKSPTIAAIAKHNEQMAMSGGYKLPVQTVSYANTNSGKHELSVKLDGDLPGAVSIANVEVHPGEESVYNFSVAEAHDYFVGTNQILVHNVLPYVIPVAAVGTAEALAVGALSCMAIPACKPELQNLMQQLGAKSVEELQAMIRNGKLGLASIEALGSFLYTTAAIATAPNPTETVTSPEQGGSTGNGNDQRPPSSSGGGGLALLWDWIRGADKPDEITDPVSATTPESPTVSESSCGAQGSVETSCTDAQGNQYFCFDSYCRNTKTGELKLRVINDTQHSPQPGSTHGTDGATNVDEEVPAGTTDLPVWSPGQVYSTGHLPHANGSIAEWHGYYDAVGKGEISVQEPGNVTDQGPDYVTYDPATLKIRSMTPNIADLAAYLIRGIPYLRHN